MTGWTKETYEGSISSRCWDYTPYNDGWDACPEIAADDELRQIVEMEQALGIAPDWAARIVETSINFAPPCGHYLFPRGFLEALTAIGSETPPALVHSCFAVAPERKREAMDYCLCLDAWLAGAPPESAARELAALGQRRIDWNSASRDLWGVLGEPTELKMLLVERLLNTVRNSIKSAIWDGDIASRSGRDQYTGSYVPSGGPGTYSNRHLAVPDFLEQESPRIQRIDARIADLGGGRSPIGPWDWWLCAPKAFRYLERRLWAIGTVGSPEPGDEVPGFLHCEDTYPDQDQAAQWWRSFCSAVNGWWQGWPQVGAAADDVNRRLGEPTPTRRWLARLFLRKIKRLEENGEEFARLVNPPPGSKRGARSVP